jgi:hypothetical protein
VPCSGVLTPRVPRPDKGEWALPPHPQPRTKDERSLRVWQTEGCAPIESLINYNETYPLERVSEAYDRMMSGKARFRVVLTIGE